LVLAHVSAQNAPQLLMASLADQVQIELADGGGEPVGVVSDEVRSIVVGRHDLISGRLAGADAFPDPGPDVLQRNAGPVGEHGGDAACERSSSPHDPLRAPRTVPVRVDAEDSVGIVVRAGPHFIQDLI
jgi:hypothetical protein